MDKINSSVKYSKWYYRSDFVNRTEFSHLQWCHLNTTNWLSNFSHLNKDSLFLTDQFNESELPSCIANIQDKVEQFRIFVVPDNW